MSTKHFSKVRNLFKFTLLFGAVTFLSYCTTSPKTASNFGKRKYTKGHFSDPVAKVKMEYKPYDENNIVNTTRADNSDNVEVNTPVNPSGEKNIKPNFTATAKSFITPAIRQLKQKGMALVKSVSKTATNNFSLRENSFFSSYPYSEHGYMQHDHGDDNKASRYLLIWIICFAVSIVTFLIAIAALGTVTTSGGCGGGCILLSISTLASIAGVVFFILWLIAISN